VISGLHRGSIWVANLPPPWKRRPVIVITRDVAIPALSNVTVVVITSTVRGLRTEVPLGAEHGLDQKCAASCDNILTLEVRRLVRRLGELGPAKTDELDAALRVALEL
jgi:mRNA interferase MazF